MMDFKKYNCYFIFLFCVLYLRLSWEECDNGMKYVVLKVDVIYGGKFVVCDFLKLLKKFF